MSGPVAFFLITLQVFILFNLRLAKQVDAVRSAEEELSASALFWQTPTAFGIDKQDNINFGLQAKEAIRAPTSSPSNAGLEQVLINRSFLPKDVDSGKVAFATAPASIEEFGSSRVASSVNSRSAELDSLSNRYKTNPLIELGEFPSNYNNNNNSNNDDDDDDGTEKTTESREKAATYKYHRHLAKNLRPLFSGETHEGRLRHRNDWCHRDCGSRSKFNDPTGIGTNSIRNNNDKLNGRSRTSNRPICASDGRFYSSLCELKRHSCRSNVYLVKSPETHCIGRRTIDGGQRETKAENKNYNNHSEEVRIVELKRRCRRAEFDEMKKVLLGEFKGDIDLMFKYFDSNGDKFVEAHELWPRSEVGASNSDGNHPTLANSLLYAQIWDDHSNKCPVGKRIGEVENYHHNEDHSKCWFFLDFAFEPHLETNPCSLSHLMLFDLKHPNNKFDRDSFGQAFENLGKISSEDKSSNQNRAADGEAQIKPLIKRLTRVHIPLGESATLNCLNEFSNASEIAIKSENSIENNNNLEIEEKDLREKECLWSRYNINLATVQNSHIFIEERTFSRLKNAVGVQESSLEENNNDLVLHIQDAQLHLSGRFKCVCHFKRISRTFEHQYIVQISAQPRVDVRPHFQWSLPSSRISFECQYDYIDTNDQCLDQTISSSTSSSLSPGKSNRELTGAECGSGTTIDGLAQFGLVIKWLKDKRELIVDSKRYNNGITAANKDGVKGNHSASSKASDSDEAFESVTSNDDDDDDDKEDSSNDNNNDPAKQTTSRVSEASSRASITMASSRLILENLQPNDTGHHTCRVEVPQTSSSSGKPFSFSYQVHSEDDGTLLVQEQPRSDQSANAEAGAKITLWLFHENGISIYKLLNDDGQEMELIREINGHSSVSGEVDGNWNQLTLCGGLNPEQVVICEWSDNALYIDVKHDHHSGQATVSTEKVMKYIYVGQPNLNRIVVMDGLKYEIVAIINTEPQPRKLHLYKPNKVHLSKWVRRRLSPAANARWLAAIGTHAHPLGSTPESRLYSTRQRVEDLKGLRVGRSARQSLNSGASSGPAVATANRMPSRLIQYDIWLLCYGQPLVVDPARDEQAESDGQDSLFSTFVGETSKANNNNSINHRRLPSAIGIQPFKPHLSAGLSPFAWSAWSNRESRLRKRKSVHIIQSTFFPQFMADRRNHNHDEDEEGAQDRERNATVFSEFKRSAVLTTHHIFPSISKLRNQQLSRHVKRHQLDFIHDLNVPVKPYSLEMNAKHKIHHAYVTHNDDRRLFRVSMDEYRYDREIDLQNCDPINLITTAQGLLVVQCRAPMRHNLIGQLVLDELTSARIEFNANIRAQDSCLSPDHRYLISIYTNTTNRYSQAGSSQEQSMRKGQLTAGGENKQSDGKQNDYSSRHQSIIFVQLITVNGLKFQYEIKTTLEIGQCSFVWKDGYYAAIFLSTNRRDQLTEILSLRLADSRLELMARVPGLIGATRYKEQLIVSPELRLAALSTNQGTYVVDLEDNRVSQSLRRHKSTPTLLWV